jgi:hypothetical protein
LLGEAREAAGLKEEIGATVVGGTGFCPHTSPLRQIKPTTADTATNSALLSRRLKV